jgi:hypothetical protein
MLNTTKKATTRWIPRNELAGRKNRERIIFAEPRITTGRQYNSRQVLFRFFFRLVVLGTFATFGTRGFAAAFAGLLALSAIFCAVTAAMRRETIFAPGLTHWDEAVAYAVMGYLISALS